MKENILAINLLRFLAACAVLSTHFYAALSFNGFISENFSFLHSITKYGHLGVNLFFIISGFVITMSSEGRTFGEFISSRFIRLFPVFWVCVSLTSLYILYFGRQFNENVSLITYLSNLTMTPGLYGNQPFIDGSYWTLAIELKFYYVIAVILLLRTFLKINIQNLTLCMCIPLLYESFFYNPYSSSFINTALRYVFHYYGESYAQYFFAGILFYGIYEGIRSYWNYVGLTICYIVALFQVLDQGSFFQLQGSEVALNPIVLMLSITLFFGLLMLISLRKIPNDLFTIHWKNSRKVFITLGAMTYPLYLLHSELIHLTVSTLQKKGDPSYIAIPVTLIIVFSCAYFVNKLDFHIHKLWKHLPLFKKIVEKNSPLLFEKLRKIL